MLLDSRWLVLLLLWGLLWLAWTWRHRTCAPSEYAAVTACVQRLLKPRTPDDCPACRRQSALPVANTPPPSAVTPWREVKCRRGAPKRINTHGFSCPNHACPYYRISDAQVHALVGQGSHGRCERIQTLQCQSCHSTFSTRRATPLYRLKTSSQRVAMVLTALAEGLDVSAAARVFGHRHATITTWLMPAGAHSTTLHDHGFRNLHLPHLHLDELRTHLRHRAHVLWLWVVVDPLTKIIAVLHHPEGTRSADPGRSAHGHSRPVWAADPWRSRGLEERWLECVLLRPHGPFWAVGHGGGATSTPVASSRRSYCMGR